MKKSFNNHLKEIHACHEAVKWVDGRGIKKAFQECKRGDWMLWYVYKNKKELGLEDMKLITLAKVRCARLVEHLMKDKRSLNALNVAENFAKGEATREELNAATDAAYAAYAAAYAAAAAAFAAVAAVAAYAAYAAAYAAADAADAAFAAVAAVAADAAVVRTEILAKCADICREVFISVKLKF